MHSLKRELQQGLNPIQPTQAKERPFVNPNVKFAIFRLRHRGEKQTGRIVLQS